MVKAERKAQQDFLLHSIEDLQLEAIGGLEFTHREIDIVACILSGKTAKKIAAFLSISPKTVENHIRNIMLKLGCRTQENIIDFIEKSNKFLAIKKHYSSLLLQSFFTAELKRIAETNQTQEKICLINIANENKECTSFVTRLVAHLKLCGIKAVLSNKQNPEEEKFDFTLHIDLRRVNDAKLSYEMADSILQTANGLMQKYSAPIIYVAFAKDPITANLRNCLQISNIALIEGNNYYLLVFALVQKIMGIDLSANVNTFTRQLEELSGAPIQTHSKQISNVPPVANDSIAQQIKQKILTYVSVIACVLLICAMVYITKMHTASDKSNIFVNTFFSWMRDRYDSKSGVALKYLENLEQEEAKLGKMEGNYDKFQFLCLRRNFIKLSNVLINLENDDDNKAQQLVKLLHDKFPLNHRTNEKVHKLFFALAAYHGKLNFIKLLTDNAQISFGDFKDYYGNTAPMLAAAGNSEQTFRWLAKNDSLFINYTNVEGNSALILAALNLPSNERLEDEAAKQASIAVLKSVLEYDGTSLKNKGQKGCTALLVAGARGNITAVKYILELLAPRDRAKQLHILENERNADGNNIMMLAAYNGRSHMIEWLHKQGISIAQCNKYKTTAFMQAASGGNIRAMDIIYRLHNESKTSPKTDLLLEKNNFGQTALFLAAHDNHINAFQWIMAKIYKNNFKDNYDLTRNYIRNARNADGDSLLHVLINGMNDTNKFNETVLNTGLLDILLDYLDVNTPAILENNTKGDTPLMRAAYYGNLGIVKYLIEKCNANPYATNDRKESVIDYAVFGGKGQCFAVIEYLWGMAAKNQGKPLAEIKHQYSVTMFPQAIKHGQKSVVEWLLRNEPELIDMLTEDGENVLDLAIKHAHIDIIEFIFAWDRKTAVRLALEKRSNVTLSIVEQLMMDEQLGKNKTISMCKYLEQKIGIPMGRRDIDLNRHNDTSYKWKSLDVDIIGLSTNTIQPWSPYYLHYDASLKARNYE